MRRPCWGWAELRGVDASISAERAPADGRMMARASPLKTAAQYASRDARARARDAGRAGEAAGLAAHDSAGVAVQEGLLRVGHCGDGVRRLVRHGPDVRPGARHLHDSHPGRDGVGPLGDSARLHDRQRDELGQHVCLRAGARPLRLAGNRGYCRDNHHAGHGGHLVHAGAVAVLDPVRVGPRVGAGRDPDRRGHLDRQLVHQAPSARDGVPPLGPARGPVPGAAADRSPVRGVGVARGVPVAGDIHGAHDYRAPPSSTFGASRRTSACTPTARSRRARRARRPVESGETSAISRGRCRRRGARARSG